MLADDGGVTLTSAFPDRPSRLLVKGTWARRGNLVAVQLENGEPLVFDYAEGRLVAREWDRTIWGEAGPGTLTLR